jgi:hypothetical protein
VARVPFLRVFLESLSEVSTTSRSEIHVKANIFFLLATSFIGNKLAFGTRPNPGVWWNDGL